MTEVSRVFVDSNILVYATFEDYEIELHKECLAQLERYHSGGTELFISGQVIREYWAQATRLTIHGERRPIPWVLGHLERFRSMMQELDESAEVRDRLVSLVEIYAVRAQDVHDTNIVATMLAYRIDTVYSNDGDFDRYVENEKISFVKPQVSTI
ncbi:MAG: type II toxin-antitoxin system VapC family toxin [Anaerolineaceae bacterium]|nr:type II toxin-antitoxin system VapC family toxin [Anaerolineaceae bacterium]